MQIRAVTAAARCNSVREHRDDFVEFFSREVAIGIGAPHEREQIVFLPFLRRTLGHNLLRQNVERTFGNHDAVQLAEPYGTHKRRAFQQFVARGCEEASLGNRSAPVSGASDSLQTSANRSRRADLADQVHRADVDSQFQRRRRDQRANFAGLQLAFRPPAFAAATRLP